MTITIESLNILEDKLPGRINILIGYGRSKSINSLPCSMVQRIVVDYPYNRSLVGVSYQTGPEISLELLIKLKIIE